VVVVLKLWLVVIIAIMIVYAIRHAIFTISRLAGRQRPYYQDIVDGRMPTLSVLIPMHNEQVVAASVLDAVLASDYPMERVEVIPIDDHSVDGTTAILKRYAAAHANVRPLYRQNGSRGKSNALNAGLAAAVNEVVIVFDADYVCNHCHEYDRRAQQELFSKQVRDAKVHALVDEIKRAGRNHDYDGVIGVSGGVDSTMVAYEVKRLGLRPLALHVDNGWNSELAVNNIELAMKKLGIDLHTIVLDWEEFKALQLAFLKASTPDAEIPTDHAISTILARMARKTRVQYVISGVNTRTETHIPAAWSQGHSDWRYIKSVHRQFGAVPLRTYPHMGYLESRRFANDVVELLNYLDYSRMEAMRLLQEDLGWKYYGGKHYESIYTRFYQGYILPRKFGYDKRRGHLSSLICSGEVTSEQALRELQSDAYPRDIQEADREYVVKKLGITDEIFEGIMTAAPRSYWDYPSYGRIAYSKPYRIARSIYRFARRRGHEPLVQTVPLAGREERS